MRRRIVALLAVGALAAGCANVPRLSGVGGSPAQAMETQERGVIVGVLPNSWQGYPPWLTRRYTPLWISLVNEGEESFDVTFSALTLVDETGQVFPAASPALVAQVAFEQQPLLPPFDLLADAAPSPQPPPGVPPASPPPSAPVPDEATPAPPTPSSPLPQQRGEVFFDLPAYSYGWVPTPGEGADGRTPFGVVPPTSPFGATGIGQEAGDILDPALREGRLLPGTHAEGFVYFPANLSASELTFRMQARSRDSSRPPLDISIRFTAR